MTSRYSNREINANYSPKYNRIRARRNVPFIAQYVSPNQYSPTAEEISELTTISHVWSLGDRFYKLADEFYGDPTLWWLIAWFNRMPTEAHVKLGWIVDIPLPIEEALILWEK